MALASWEAKYDEMHKDRPFHNGTFANWSAERTEQTPFHYRDGVTIWPASMDLNPEDDFLTTGPSALASDADEPSGDHADADDQ